MIRSKRYESIDSAAIAAAATATQRYAKGDFYVSLLLAAFKACSCCRELELGRRLHRDAAATGLVVEDLYVGNSLVNMYAKCGSLLDAQGVFDAMPRRDAVSWNTLMTGYVVNGENEITLKLFDEFMASELDDPGSSRQRTVLPGDRSGRQPLISASGSRLNDPALVASESRPQDRTLLATGNKLPACSYDETSSPTRATLREQCSSRTFVAAVMACSALAEKERGITVNGKTVKAESLRRGTAIHALASKCGWDENIYVANTLIGMYSKCGCVAKAYDVFSRLTLPSVVSWNAIILGCVENGEAEFALELYDRIQEPELVDSRTLVSVLMACVSLAVTHKWSKEACLRRGTALHSFAVDRGCLLDVYVGSTLVDMYSSCERLDCAREVFERMRERDVVVWNAMIQGYIDNGEGEMALQMFRRMSCCEDGVLPDASTFVAASTACAGLAAREAGFQCGYDEPEKFVKLQSLQDGMEIHKKAAKSGHISNFFVASSLVVMYAKCGSMEDARAVFDRLPVHDAVCWTALILGYAESNEAELALQLFWCMQREEGCVPSSRTFVTALTACTGLAAKEQGQEIDEKLARLASLEKGMAIHCEATKFAWGDDLFLASSLVDVYGKCGSVLDARLVFDRMPLHDTVSWTAMIQACGENGEHEAAMELFVCMEAQGLVANARTRVAVLSSFATLAARKGDECGGAAAEIQVDKQVVAIEYLEKVMSTHSCCFEVDFIMENALIDAYSKCGSMIDARKVFDRMQSHDVVSWNALILGLVDNREAGLAVELFARLTQFRSTPAAPDARSFAAVLAACSNLAALDTGRLIHAQVCRLGVEAEPYISNCLVGLYSRCGCINNAEELFCSISDQKDPVAWSALVTGYSSQGSCDKVFGLLEAMREEGLQADGVALLGVLSACSHAGLVEKGKDYFAAMVPRYGVRPELKHYQCMIDMLGRANLVDEAVKLAETMPYKPTGMTWTIILAACRKWSDHATGNAAFQELLKLEPENAAAYLMMANICTQTSSD